MLHVTVQLLTSKTGFREFEQQSELRERGLQTTTRQSIRNEPAERLSSLTRMARDQTDKVAGITLSIMKQALLQAREGRKVILGEMSKCSPPPSKGLSKYAPLILVMKASKRKTREPKEETH